MIQEPLAYRMRPKTIENVIGQTHLLGEGKPINRMVRNNRVSSMILFGPPGIGKTSIASAIAGSISIPFRKLNAVSAGKKDLEEVVKEAKFLNDSICLYVDEIHRFSKTQIEYLLPFVESGEIVLVGATTESVFHSLPGAILSRCTVYELKPLSPDEIIIGLERALNDEEQGLALYNVGFEEGVLNHIAAACGGDMRSALNALETIVISNADKHATEKTVITMGMAEEQLHKKSMGYNGEDTLYNLMSAYQKSCRGSDVNAALHYLARMLESGELITVCRRLLVIAWEDVGLADPSVGSTVLDAIQSAERLGLPEARIPLSVATTIVCLSPKSNTAYTALDLAWNDVREGNIGDVPDSLKDAHYSGAKKLNRGIGYKYPHDFGGWVDQQYLPDILKHKEYYQPKDHGKEKNYALMYNKIKEIKSRNK